MNFDAQKSRANFCRFELKHIYIDAIEVSMQMIRQHPEDGFEKFYKEFTKNEILAALQDLPSYVDALNEIDRLTDIVRQVKTREITNEEFDDWWKDIESVEKNELAKKWHTAYRKAQNSNLVRKQQIQQLNDTIRRNRNEKNKIHDRVR